MLSGRPTKVSKKTFKKGKGKGPFEETAAKLMNIAEAQVSANDVEASTEAMKFKAEDVGEDFGL